MPVIYLCPTGTYSSVIAANLHLKYLKIDANLDDILNLPFFGEYPDKTGNFFYIGKDSENEFIYTLGVSNEPKLIIRSAYDLLRINGYAKETINFIDVSKYTPKYILWYNNFFSLKNKKYAAKEILKELPLLQKEIKKRQEL